MKTNVFTPPDEIHAAPPPGPRPYAEAALDACAAAALCASGEQTVRRRRLIRVRHRVVFGTLAAIEHVLAAYGWQINTAVIEQLHLAIPEHVAAAGRRVAPLCQGEEGLRQQLALYHTAGYKPSWWLSSPAGGLCQGTHH